MEVKKTFFKHFLKLPENVTGPRGTTHNAADKQVNLSKKEETLIFYQHQKSCVASPFYGKFLKMGDFGWI